MQRRDGGGICSVTLLKEETLCSRGLRLLAVAAAVSWAVRACNCTTRPASKACSRDGCGFCCCSCRLCTSCCNCKRHQRPHLLHPYSHRIETFGFISRTEMLGLNYCCTDLLSLGTLQDLRYSCNRVSVVDLRRPVRQPLDYISRSCRGRRGPCKTHSGVMLKSPEVDCGGIAVFPSVCVDPPGVVLLTWAALPGITGVTLGGGIPAARSNRGWMMSLLKTAFFCHRFRTRTILL